MLLITKRTLSYLVLAVTFFFFSALFALDSRSEPLTKAPPKCAPLQPPPLQFPSWSEDSNYDLVETEVTGGKRIRITGDLIKITPEDFGSIVRDVDKAPGNVREIIFDGREIQLNAPLSFTSAKVVFLADVISLGPHGAIYINDPPGPPSDGLKIAARTLVFTKSLPRPFQFTTTSAGN